MLQVHYALSTTPRSLLRGCFEHTKPSDAVVVGIFSKYEDQVALNVQHVIEVTENL